MKRSSVLPGEDWSLEATRVAGVGLLLLICTIENRKAWLSVYTLLKQATALFNLILVHRITTMKASHADMLNFVDLTRSVSLLSADEIQYSLPSRAIVLFSWDNCTRCIVCIHS